MEGREISSWKIDPVESIDSTNLEARRRARGGERRKTLILAGEQTAGRGRMERRWVSPAGAGLWMTQLFFPEKVPAERAGGAVFLSAVALCRTLREITGAQVGVKWPNDLVLSGKKICGMLAECGFEGDRCAWIGLGTGLNLRKGALPPELIYASSLEEITGRAPEPEEILEKYLPEFDRLEKTWEEAGLAPVLEEYRPLCVSLGKDVRVNGVAARALEVEKNGALRVRYAETGEVRAVLAGDVSVRGMTDYI